VTTCLRCAAGLQQAGKELGAMLGNHVVKRLERQEVARGSGWSLMAPKSAFWSGPSEVMALPGVSAEVLALLTVGLRINGCPCEAATSPTSGAPRLHQGGEVAKQSCDASAGPGGGHRRAFSARRTAAPVSMLLSGKWVGEECHATWNGRRQFAGAFRRWGAMTHTVLIVHPEEYG